MLWALVLLAASLGLLGPGWLSRRVVASPGGELVVAYDRFLHYHHPSEIEISCRGLRLVEGKFHVTVDQALLDRVQILRIEPEPDEQHATAHGVAYAFRGDAAATAAKIVFHVKYQRYGSAVGHVALGGRDPATLRQFVYP
jgi:hypothetical protein